MHWPGTLHHSQCRFTWTPAFAKPSCFPGWLQIQIQIQSRIQMQIQILKIQIQKQIQLQIQIQIPVNCAALDNGQPWGAHQPAHPGQIKLWSNLDVGFLQFKIRGFTDGARMVVVFLRSWLEVLGTWVLEYLRSAAESWSRMMSLTPSSPALFVHIKICFNL